MNVKASQTTFGVYNNRLDNYLYRMLKGILQIYRYSRLIDVLRLKVILLVATHMYVN